MQWLIDLVIEAIGIPPTFIHRGDPAVADFLIGDFTKDGFWYDLDLSAIVPAGATAVSVFIILQATVISRSIALRKKGQVNSVNQTIMFTQVANLLFSSDILVAVDPDRKIEYKIAAGVNQRCDFTVKGWWL